MLTSKSFVTSDSTRFWRLLHFQHQRFSIPSPSVPYSKVRRESFHHQYSSASGSPRNGSQAAISRQIPAPWSPFRLCSTGSNKMADLGTQIRRVIYNTNPAWCHFSFRKLLVLLRDYEGDGIVLEKNNPKAQGRLPGASIPMKYLGKGYPHHLWGRNFLIHLEAWKGMSTDWVNHCLQYIGGTPDYPSEWHIMC